MNLLMMDKVAVVIEKSIKDKIKNKIKNNAMKSMKLTLQI